jgi:hypothetical protein
VASISGSNHFWQNWSKTHAYVAERMFFPRYPDDIADAVKQAEAQQRPIRAVGSGWSFSDASLPGAVTTNRPDVNALEALAEVLPRTVTFPTSTTQPSIASVPTGMRGADGMGSMIMIADPGGGIDPGFALWSYSGAGTWTKGQWTYRPTGPGFLDYLAGAGDRPVRTPPMGALVEDTDVAGSLVMFDLAKSPARPSRDWFYNGQGIWSVGINGDSPFAQGSLAELKSAGRIGPNSLLSPRAAGSGEAMSLVLSRNSSDTPKLPESVFLVDLRLLTSSLQQSLPDILSQSALDATSTNRPVFAGRRFFFHVESGITMPQLRVLLSHQSPRLSLRGNTGSSGGMLAGALSRATHGAEFKWPLLVDTVKAVHMVGPGGHHWWIEGDESIVDPQKLRQAHPEFASERIILGTDTIAGVKPQDWLNAAIVSMGCMGSSIRSYSKSSLCSGCTKRWFRRHGAASGTPSRTCRCPSRSRRASPSTRNYDRLARAARRAVDSSTSSSMVPGMEPGFRWRTTSTLTSPSIPTAGPTEISTAGSATARPRSACPSIRNRRRATTSGTSWTASRGPSTERRTAFRSFATSTRPEVYGTSSGTFPAHRRN